MMLSARIKGNGSFKSREMGKNKYNHEKQIHCLINYVSMPDWTELYPLHKFACAGDEEGVMRSVRLGMSPDERDSDTWTPLHYACW